tara:strand:- start:4925 stop:5176 length:252 start_codon:yes stop_codon:yes gene_type:complete
MSTQLTQAHNLKPVEGTVEKLNTYSEYWIYKEQIDAQIDWLNNLDSEEKSKDWQTYKSLLNLLASLKESCSGCDGVVIESGEE